jgi:membrane associated rhomboid family serine protease
MGILWICILMQFHSCVATPGIEKRAVEVELEMAKLKRRIVAAGMRERLIRAKPKSEEKSVIDFTEEDLRDLSRNELIEKLSGPDPEYLELQTKVTEEFEAGTLVDDSNEQYARYLQFEAELEALVQKHPTMRFGYRPAIDGLASILSSMFAHGGWLHLIGNMWFLYLVGCNLEDRWGRWQFGSFYVIVGIIAALTFTALHPEEEMPLVGASGAVAGAMGAFMVCFAKTKVRIFYLYFIFFTPRHGTFLASAWLVAAFWLAEQLVWALVEAKGGGGGVAFSAHVGGFLFGSVVAALLMFVGVDQQLDEAVERAADEATVAFKEDPLYLEAMERLDRGDEPGARERLVTLIAEQPRHVGAREALFNLGTRTRDLELLDYSVRFLLEDYARRNAYEAAVELFRQLRIAMPDYGLTDRELLHVASSAKHEQRPQAAIAAITELIQQHPDSRALPRALLVAAEVQQHYGAHDHQRDTLERIVQRFPDHACATVARDRLAALGAAS